MKKLTVLLPNRELISIVNLEHLWIDRNWWTMTYVLKYEDSRRKFNNILYSRKIDKLYDILYKIAVAYDSEDEFLDLTEK